MTNKELLEYFDLLDEDDTEEDIEEFEGIYIENDEGDSVFFSLEDLQKAQGEGQTLADLMLTR